MLDNPNDGDSATERVKRFYETFPYPAVATDRPVDRTTMLGDAWCVMHHALDCRPSRTLRILVAGGGTGVALQALGTTLAGAGIACEFVYVDLSSVSADIARKRAEDAGVTNVRYLVQPIESLSPEAVGQFDYIDFSGVINHVADPALALACLAALVKPQGGIGIMAYGRHGRTGIYQMQNALRLLAQAPGAGEPVALARALLGALPSGNWIAKNPHLADLSRIPDAELADRYLNPNDRAFEISELNELCREVGLQIRGLVRPFLYDPAPLMPTPEARAAVRALPVIEQAQIAELLLGFLHIHQFFAVPADRAPVDHERLLDRDDTRVMPLDGGGQWFDAFSRTPGKEVRIGLIYGAIQLAQPATFNREECKVISALRTSPTVGEVRGVLAGQGVEAVHADHAIRRVYSVFSRLGMVHLLAVPTP